jgi:DNA-binding LacI/PurR family transcriptional regulator
MLNTMSEMSEAKRVTLGDVAHMAGVSAQTVSRVVNNHPYVSDETRQRVMNAIHRLDYRPNRAARSLVTQRSYMVGIITFGIPHYGPAQMLTHIERMAKARGYGVEFSSISHMSADEVRDAIANLGDHAIDGLVLLTPVTGVSHAELIRVCGGIPFVQIDIELGTQAPSVVIDQWHGSHLVTQHLIDLGHREICEISGPLNWHGAQARHHSWAATMQAAGLTPGLSVEGDWSARSGYERACELLARGAHFTALVVGNDQMALGAMRALREHDRRIPDDVSVVGFDDMPEAAYFEPPLTTVRQDFAALGEQSMEYLVALLDNPHTPIHQRVLYPEFVERRSTARAK